MVRQRYAYDTYGRVTSDKGTEPGGNSLEKRYVYNTDGRVRLTNYYINGSNEGTEENLYANGHVREIYFNGNSIFKITEQNTLGQTTKVTTGAVARQYNYNVYGIPTGRTAGSFLNSTYNFEASTGNLLSRKDNTRNKTEGFGYDGTETAYQLWKLYRRLRWQGQTLPPKIRCGYFWLQQYS